MKLKLLSMKLLLMMTREKNLSLNSILILKIMENFSQIVWEWTHKKEN